MVPKRILLAAAVGTLLTACAPTLTRHDDIPTQTRLRAPHPIALAPAADAPAPQAAPPKPRTVAPLPPSPPTRPAFPRLAKADLTGVSAEAALQLLGAPTDAGRLRGDTVWRYENASCRLDLHFHFSVADNALRAYRAEIGWRIGPEISEELCLHTLAKDRVRVARQPDG